jgi:hypothetical protein
MTNGEGEHPEREIQRELALTTPMMMGPDVKELQDEINKTLGRFRLRGDLREDGEFGEHTLRLTAKTAYALGSADGGSTWGEPRERAGPMPIEWFPNTTYGRMVGDYLSTSFSHARAFPFFAEANRPKSDGSFDEAIATVRGGVHVSGRRRP